jgi:hypothetical protein
MKTYILEPINKAWHYLRTVCIIGSIGAFVCAGFVVMGIETIRDRKRERYYRNPGEENY